MTAARLLSTAIVLAGFTASSCRGPSDESLNSTTNTGLIDTSFVIFESDSLYTAWPAVARIGGDFEDWIPGRARDDEAAGSNLEHRTSNLEHRTSNARKGDIVVFYTQTDEHMGPDGRIVGVRSSDEGMTWSSPFLVYDTPLDERESGITVLDDGRLVVHLWSTRHTEESYGRMPPGSYYDHTVAAWIEEVNSASYAEAEALEGGHAIMSSDGGRTWSEPVDGPDTIHGGIQMHDGSILVASYRLSRDFVTLHRAESWEGPYVQIAEVHSPQPDSLRFGEPSILQLPSGRVIMMMRVTPKPYSDSDPRSVLWESYSDDGGQTWVEAYPTPLWGFPPHLMLHSDGQVVVVYGRRIPPFGQRAAVSSDGITWREEDEIVLRNDAPNKDLGYPASVELSDGRVLTVYYQSHPSDTLRLPEGPPPDRHKPDIYGTVWRMP